MRATKIIIQKNDRFIEVFKYALLNHISKK